MSLASPKAPATATLPLGLDEDNDAGGRCRRRLNTTAAIDAGKFPRGGRNSRGRGEDEGPALVRQRCFSESRGRPGRTAAPLARRPIATRMFSFGDSIAFSTDRLGRIRQELHAVHSDLDGRVTAIRRQLSQDVPDELSPVDDCDQPWPSSNSSGSPTSSASSREGSFSSGCGSGRRPSTTSSEMAMAVACSCAVRDLRAADAARAEFRAILSEVGAAWTWEGREMETRAGWLTMEGEAVFEKMSPSALKKLRHRCCPAPATAAGDVGKAEESGNEVGDLSKLVLSISL